ncbi:hypothetical protein [Salinigranum salinum]|uniref:hypothetical protein n=1 Tax=Salinigranum salinum TaxID=1364937 RepID=UPI0012609FEA|nr:hypothetical protein [Salinigranum salinum]
MSEESEEKLTGPRIGDLAREYLEAETEGPDHSERLAKLRELRSELKIRREDYSERFSPSHPIVKRIDKKIESIDADIEDLEQEQEVQESLRDDFLKISEQFELTEEWLQPIALRALNHALYGSEREDLIIDKTRIETVEDVTELSYLERLDFEEKMLRVIEDARGNSSHTDEIWEWVQQEDRLELFAVMSSEASADKNRLSDVLGIESKTAKNRVEYPIYQHGPELTPYHSEGGTYRLTTPARYVAAKHGPFEYNEMEKEVEETATGEDEGTLSSFAQVDDQGDEVAVDGGDVDE